MFEDSLVTTRLSGPQEPPSDQSTSQPSSKMDKGKAKMLECEDDNFDDTESTHSLNREFCGLDVPIGVKKALTSANQKLCHFTREKNPVSRFGYNDYMVYHYAFMVRIKLKCGLVFELTLRVNRHSKGQESPLSHHYVFYHLVWVIESYSMTHNL